jgi:ATP-dependent RNA helicase DHX37/DHR1
MRRAKITKLGKAMAAFPVAPRFGKMLALSHQVLPQLLCLRVKIVFLKNSILRTVENSMMFTFQHNLLPFTITMVAALSMQEVLLERPIGDYSDSLDQNQLIQIRKAWLGKGQSLLLVRLITTPTFSAENYSLL